ncbi:endocuticle structural glycoprotein SgAbd-2 [Harpegnathos saltator]|uniref:Endocuticle structural glycoprotein SgAbd-1 n=1 Tax=Harpegnathos saltator TaxID=610380 RepID=E2C0K2_HARSA|nr:endocuticle structural glycoprotein SgAbd-2 [Harpegnathos saltator]EFN78519.1 Endocuticle structural glycoprotein SgAbd-1 [Harpegnathos saltator]
MQYLILALALFGCAFGQFGPYRGFSNQNAYRPTPRPYQPQPQPQPLQPQYTSPGKFIAIRSQQKDSSPDGSYSFSYETENGISVSESGHPQAGPQGQTEVVQGRYSYPAPDGTPITIEYTADENGFHAQGAHIPTPPPIPEAIRRALAANPPGPDDSKYDQQQPFQQRFGGPVYNANPFRRF